MKQALQRKIHYGRIRHRQAMPCVLVHVLYHGVHLSAEIDCRRLDAGSAMLVRKARQHAHIGESP